METDVAEAFWLYANLLRQQGTPCLLTGHLRIDKLHYSYGNENNKICLI